MPTACIRVSVQVLVPPPQIQFPVDTSWEAPDDGQSIYASATCVRDLGGVPASWVRPGLPLAVQACYDASSKPSDERSLSLSAFQDHGNK